MTVLPEPTVDPTVDPEQDHPDEGPDHLTEDPYEPTGPDEEPAP